MNQKALKALEYYKIIEKLTEKASSPMGKDLCRRLLPGTDINEIRLMQTQTKDALTRLFPERKPLLRKCKRCPRFSETPGNRQYPGDFRNSYHLRTSGKYQPCQSIRTE